ncbi:hypothetical protein [Myxosarcina sp. GI1(2024)]
MTYQNLADLTRTQLLELQQEAIYNQDTELLRKIAVYQGYRSFNAKAHNLPPAPPNPFKKSRDRDVWDFAH